MNFPAYGIIQKHASRLCGDRVQTTASSIRICSRRERINATLDLINEGIHNHVMYLFTEEDQIEVPREGLALVTKSLMVPVYLPGDSFTFDLYVINLDDTPVSNIQSVVVNSTNILGEFEDSGDPTESITYSTSESIPPFTVQRMRNPQGELSSSTFRIDDEFDDCYYARFSNYDPTDTDVMNLAKVPTAYSLSDCNITSLFTLYLDADQETIYDGDTITFTISVSDLSDDLTETGIHLLAYVEGIQTAHNDPDIDVSEYLSQDFDPAKPNNMIYLANAELLMTDYQTKSTVLALTYTAIQEPDTPFVGFRFVASLAGVGIAKTFYLSEESFPTEIERQRSGIWLHGVYTSSNQSTYAPIPFRTEFLLSPQVYVINLSDQTLQAQSGFIDNTQDYSGYFIPGNNNARSGTFRRNSIPSNTALIAQPRHNFLGNVPGEQLIQFDICPETPTTTLKETIFAASGAGATPLFTIHLDVIGSQPLSVGDLIIFNVSISNLKYNLPANPSSNILVMTAHLEAYEIDVNTTFVTFEDTNELVSVFTGQLRKEDFQRKRLIFFVAYRMPKQPTRTADVVFKASLAGVEIRHTFRVRRDILAIDSGVIITLAEATQAAASNEIDWLKVITNEHADLSLIDLLQGDNIVEAASAGLLSENLELEAYLASLGRS